MKTKQILTVGVMALALSGCGDVASSISGALSGVLNTTIDKVEDTIASLRTDSGAQTSATEFAMPASSQGATAAFISAKGSEEKEDTDGTKFVTLPEGVDADDLEKAINLDTAVSSAENPSNPPPPDAPPGASSGGLLPLMSFSVEATETTSGSNTILTLNKRANKPLLTYSSAVSQQGASLPAGYTLQLVDGNDLQDTNPKFYVSPVAGETAITLESPRPGDPDGSGGTVVGNPGDAIAAGKARVFGGCAGVKVSPCDTARANDIKGHKGKYSIALSWIVESSDNTNATFHRGTIASAAMYTPYTQEAHNVFASSGLGGLVYTGHYSYFAKGNDAVTTGAAEVTVKGVAGGADNSVVVAFTSGTMNTDGYSIDGKFDRINSGTMLVFAGALKKAGNVEGDASGFFAGPKAEEVGGVFSKTTGTNVDFAGSFWGDRPTQ